MDAYQTFIYKRSYSRWIPELGRREEWDETVSRYRDYFLPRVPPSLRFEFEVAIDHIRTMDVMPSMRCLWSAGEALDVDNIAGYNCAYTTIQSIKDFSEILYILMNGAGVGFSTERQYINDLPVVPEKIEERHSIISEVGDSKLGWALAFDHLLHSLYSGFIPKLDLSKIRPKGAPLKTFGGRASGPEPLLRLIKFTVNTFKKAQGRRLNSLEVYDIVCMIANCVVSGGVRRSSTINLSNLTDMRMRGAKDGQFWIENPQRMLSNNSVSYTEKPDVFIFMDEWRSMAKSGTGERGIVNRVSLQKSAKDVGREVRDFGTNPCGEIILRPRQFCNLTEVILRPGDTEMQTIQKIRSAVLLGSIQSTLTDFHYLSPEWKKNTEEERLLGVSLTGLMDSVQSFQKLRDYYSVARTYSEVVAHVLGLNTVPKAITCVKPSGTVSQLVDSSSGIHPRYSPFYIRRVRVASTDPVAQLLIDSGVPWYPEVGQTAENATTLVFEFPHAAPEGSLCRSDLTALDQLEFWLKMKKDWCDHNPSCTIYVREHEWLAVGAWVYDHWDDIGGLSFLPFDGGLYELAPYEEITEEKFHELNASFPQVNWELLPNYEQGDTTEGSKTYSCSGDKCEIS